MLGRAMQSMCAWFAPTLRCRTSAQRRRRWALTASGLLHSSVLLGLAFVVLTTDQPEGAFPLAIFSKSETADRQELTPPAEVPLSFDGGGAHVGTTVLNSVGDFSVNVSTPSAFLSSPSERPSDAPSNFELLEHISVPAAGRSQAESVGEGTGTTNGNGAGSKTGFFGIHPEGTRFIYVVDCSNSMNAPHEEAKTRFQRLKLELLKSIGGLREDMQFYVIFFSSEAFPMPATEMQFASPQNKQLYLHWVAKARAFGGTDPANALKHALKLRPDVIYLLTDGDFDEKFGKRLDKINKHRVAIHTFGFGDKAADKLLRHIAENNRGTYTYVP